MSMYALKDDYLPSILIAILLYSIIKWKISTIRFFDNVHNKVNFLLN